MIKKQSTYRLEGRIPVPCELLEWGRLYEGVENSLKRRVAFNEFGEYISISTVFLGLDHNFDNEGPPILFETMIFGGSLDGQCQRYSTYEEAEVGHEKMVDSVFRELQGFKS